MFDIIVVAAATRLTAATIKFYFRTVWQFLNIAFWLGVSINQFRTALATIH
jgi:hypothetical protein